MEKITKKKKPSCSSSSNGTEHTNQPTHLPIQSRHLDGFNSH